MNRTPLFRKLAELLARGMVAFVRRFNPPAYMRPLEASEWDDVAKLLAGQYIDRERRNYIKAKLAALGG